MRVEVTDGSVVVRAEDVGPLLGLEPREVPRLMREGALRCLHERGEGEDAGRFRVTIWHAGTRLRLTCAEDGTVLTRLRASTAPATSPPAAPPRG